MEFEAFLRTKGQAAGGAKKTVVKACGAANELWSKLMSAKKNGPFMPTAVLTRVLFVPPAALTRVLLRHQLFGPHLFLSRQQ